MARIAGVDLPKEKPVWVGLTYIYGVGKTKAKQIAFEARVDPQKKIKQLTEQEVGHLRRIIERGIKVEGALRREVQQNIRRLIEIGCYRGIRHQKGLPVRGQRTRHNARTRKGRRKTVAIKKRKERLGIKGA